MATCLTLGGDSDLTLILALQEKVDDLSEALDGLITSLLAQGVESHIILEDVKQAIEKNEAELRLLNARTEEAYNTGINKEDVT